MKIRVTFADGTSEERDELSMAHEDPSIPIEQGGVSAYPLYEVRGFSMWFERVGKWEEASIETPNEQVARLTAERDRAAAIARLWKQYAKSERKMGRMVGDIKARMNVLIIDLAAAVGSRLPDGAGIWTSDLLDKAKALYAERDAARCALQDLLDDCATWRAHRGATGMGAHLPHDLMSAPPSVVQHIERATKRGLGQ